MTAVEDVRLLIADLDPDEAKRLLTDAQLEQLLTLNGDSVRLAAADALEIIATSEALLSKKITTQDLSTDGPAVAAALLNRAAVLRKQAAETDDTGGDFAFEIVDAPQTTCPPELTEHARWWW